MRFEGPGAVGASTHGGETITIVGDHFGADPSAIEAVRYGDLGEPEFDVTSSCSLIEPHTKIQCTTAEGVGGASIEWVVTVNRQHSTAPRTSAAVPIITTVELVNKTDGALLPSANVAGGDVLRIHGDHFTTTSRRIDWVRYGVADNQVEARGCVIREAHTLIECETASAGGRDLPVLLSISGQQSAVTAASPAISYTPPRVVSTTPRHIDTAGGGRLTIVGSSLGPLGYASVLLDGEQLEVARVGQDMRELVVLTPPGTGASHELVVVQSAVPGSTVNEQRSTAFSLS